MENLCLSYNCIWSLKRKQETVREHENNSLRSNTRLGTLIFQYSSRYLDLKLSDLTKFNLSRTSMNVLPRSLLVLLPSFPVLIFPVLPPFLPSCRTHPVSNPHSVCSLYNRPNHSGPPVSTYIFQKTRP